MIEELWEALGHSADNEVADADEEELEIVMAVGDTSPKMKRKTMRLHGVVGDQDVLILVDSGSVGTFVSAKLADKRKHPAEYCEPAQYVAADGSPMACDKVLKNLQWSSQGHIFTVNAGVLPLECYDMIVGEDWLEDCSPMWVHWRKKIMKFTYKGKLDHSPGVHHEVTKCSAISAGKLKGLLRKGAISHCVQMLPRVVHHAFADQEAEVHSVTFPEAAEIPSEV